MWPILFQLEHKRNDEKVERDRLNGIYLELVEQQRAYYKSVRDFQEVSNTVVCVVCVVGISC